MGSAGWPDHEAVEWGPSAVSPSAVRRIVAVVLPELVCEVAMPQLDRRLVSDEPLGVVVTEPGTAVGELKGSTPLSAVNAAAQRCGVVAGQTIAEARALAAGLVVRQVPRAQVVAALRTVAEVALGFGPTVALESEALEGAAQHAFDVVWVDITGVAHLFDGEEQLVAELLSSVRALGHAAIAAVGEGPWLAQALARWGTLGSWGPREVAQLPVMALPISAEQASWLVRLGIHTWGELAALPRAAALARLSEHGGAGQAATVLDLCAGRDVTPLIAYQPPRVLVEERSFDDAIDGLSPLTFVLRGLTARLAARLMGRGQAAQALVLVATYDRSIAALRGAAPELTLRLDLTPPLWRENELLRLLLTRLERLRLQAPIQAVRLEVPLITHALARQLDLLEPRGLDELPLLLAELTADIGAERVGVLRVVDSHRPEAQSVLGQAVLTSPTVTRRRREGARRGRARSAGASATVSGASPVASSPVASSAAVGLQGKQPRLPTRLLSRPLPLRVALRVGGALFLGKRAYTIERITFDRRIEAVEWWSKSPASRDYYRLLLRGAGGVAEAWIFVELSTNARYLQGIYD